MAQVRAALFRGELRPGDHLGSESELAQRLGVSRVPVRDAFRSLQAMGIVEVRRGAAGGARIAAGNPSRFAEALAVQFKLIGITLEELFESQTATETAAVRLAARHATATDFAVLEAILGRLAESRRDAARFTQEALAFHRAVVEASHNRALIAQSQALLEVLYQVLVPQTTPTLAARVLRKHCRLVDFIRAGDGDTASEAMAEHLEQVRRRVLRERARHDGSGPARRRSRASDASTSQDAERGPIGRRPRMRMPRSPG
ncbi:MAG TPA: FCD domain-containing protein [Hyphomicrobiales bacterium]|nr:FCD domain-containing protein [Hyphomicrobiales bacterium]